MPRKRPEFVPGDFYLNPEAGPLWVAGVQSLTADTRIVPDGKPLRVELNAAGLDHFFNTLILATPKMQEERRREQELKAKQYKVSSRNSYAYTDTYIYRKG